MNKLKKIVKSDSESHTQAYYYQQKCCQKNYLKSISELNLLINHSFSDSFTIMISSFFIKFLDIFSIKSLNISFIKSSNALLKDQKNETAEADNNR